MIRMDNVETTLNPTGYSVISMNKLVLSHYTHYSILKVLDLSNLSKNEIILCFSLAKY